MKKIFLAISKGRIMDEALMLLKKNKIECNISPNDSRKLIFDTNYDNLGIIIVRASDVPLYIESGKVDLGIVGKDTLLESNVDNYFFLKDLKIASCKLVVAGKKNKKLVSNMKIATKYPSLTQDFFLSKGIPCSILKLYGSIELASVLNLSDAIVDLVDTGKTLKENGLEEICLIDKISSHLIVNKSSYKIKKTQIDNLMARISSK
tara:strand:- start:556 stop:1173 length:618 start_codon:yes stop_codon:yes gene_type:complete